MLHADMHEGSVFTGRHATLWNLGEEELHERLLAFRERGEDVWLDGQPFGWTSSVLHVYEGPATDEIADFSPMLGPGAYAVTGVLHEVTDRYIKGPPGGTGTAGDLAGSTLRPEGSAIFVVHGSNVAWREEVARFLEQVVDRGHPIDILHERHNGGQTIVEKLERAASEARYAVVLLTGDDEGRRRGEERLQMRARQNVVLELGYFSALLGRENVAVLYEAGVEIPSDISGLVYIQLDEAGGWKLRLVKELRAGQIDVDVQRLV